MKPGFALQHVVLRTADLSRSEAFYAGVLGLTARHPAPGLAEFSPRAGTAPLVIVREETTAPAAPPRVAGLFHLAILVPDRPSLAAALVRLVGLQQPLQGLSDHGVSEAIYLEDPDGNGIELYRDRPRAEWPMDGDKLAMVTRRLEVDSLLREVPQPPPDQPLAGAVLGHVHLSVTDLARARAFYGGELGLDLRQDNYPGALFFAADGYHHHVAVNTWGGARLPLPARAAGLVEIAATITGGAAPRRAIDPDGIPFSLTPG
ncbi:MAG: VOC family protein [Opitutales bacterium]